MAAMVNLLCCHCVLERDRIPLLKAMDRHWKKHTVSLHSLTVIIIEHKPTTVMLKMLRGHFTHSSCKVHIRNVNAKTAIYTAEAQFVQECLPFSMEGGWRVCSQNGF